MTTAAESLRGTTTRLRTVVLCLSAFATLAYRQQKPTPTSLDSLKNVIHYRSGPTCFKDLASHFAVFWADRIYSFPNSHSSVDPSETAFLAHGWKEEVVSEEAESFGVGPQLVTGLYGDDSIVFTPALLNARVTTIDGKAVAPVGAIERNDYPYGVTESQSYPGRVSIAATTVFAALDTLFTEYTLQKWRPAGS
jgi:hypothetical protein